ncbi:MAG: pilin, partial [Proteobacteria bacterium]|nr:pilin [Pseudomonadota bacterium]
VTGINVAAGGGIDITFGNQANAANLATEVLSLRPAPNANGDLIWVCGNKAVPAGATAPTATNGTTVANKYLPAACRA